MAYHPRYPWREQLELEHHHHHDFAVTHTVLLHSAYFANKAEGEYSPLFDIQVTGNNTGLL